MPIDPNCGREVSTKTPFKQEQEGVTHYFCSAECQEQFDWTADEEEELQQTGPYPERPETED